MKDSKHLTLVDGSGYIFRAFHALPPMTRSDGTPVNAVYGFTNMLLKLLESLDGAPIAVIFDAKRKNFRNDIFAAYKANRTDPPEELIPQFPLIREATEALNITAIEREGFEADDIIATYCEKAKSSEAEVTIVSSDKDLMQLIRPGVKMLDPLKNRELGEAEALEKFGVPPEKIVDVQALAGDPTDNIPGIEGIGIKTAAQLIQEFGNLETLLDRAGEIKQPKRRESLMNGRERALISKQLVMLKNDIADLPSLDHLARHEMNREKLLEFLKKNEFKSLLARLETQPVSSPVISENSSKADIARTYTLITTRTQLQSLIDKIYTTGRCAVDTETTSLNPREAKICGISIAATPGEAFYIPVGHACDDLLDNTPLTQLPMGFVIETLRPVLEDPSILKIGQNIKYDFGVLKRAGITLNPISDTMLLSYVTAAGKNAHNFDDLVKLHLGQKTIEYKDVVGTGKSQKRMDQIHPDMVLNYACQDADLTLQLYDILNHQMILEKTVAVYECIERPLIPIISDMEQRGVKVDPNVLRGLSKTFSEKMVTTEKAIFDIAGREFNINSPKQLGEVLFDELGMEGGKKTQKSGDYQTGVDILEKLAGEGHAIAQLVLDWRHFSKLKSTYADTLPAQIVSETGRVHTSFSMAGTTTGRLSSSDPNLQNIPIRSEEGRMIRSAFVAENGHKLISIDYSQIELRLLAHVGDVKGLKEAFNNGLDIHAYTASLVFGVPMDGMDPMIRRNAKAINFGIIYGISPYGLAKNLAIDASQAKEFIDAYFKTFPEIRDYMESQKTFARQHGYVKTPFGRKCFVPYIKDKNGMRRNYAERAAINAPLQGANADIIKRAMIRLPKALLSAGLSSQMILQVHDELIFEAPEAEVDQTIKIARSIMENAHEPLVHLSVPLICDAGVGDTWAQAH